MGNNKPLLAHLCLFGSGAFWGLMAPVGKDAMTHGIEGIDMVSFRVLGGAILFWLTSLFTRREHIPTTDIIKLAGAGLFGLVFNQCCYHRTEHHLAQQFEHHDYIDAYLRHDSVVPHPPRAHHLEEGGWRTLRLQRCRAHHHDKCHGGKCQGGKHLGRLTLHGRTTVVCALSVALQALGGKVFALHHQQVDVHLGIGHDPAFLRLSCGFHHMG